MRNFNVNPYFRSSVGFDNFLNSALNSQKSSSLPYNIVKKSDDDYSISLALAGWNESDLTITKDKNTLTVSGKSSKEVWLKALTAEITTTHFFKALNAFLSSSSGMTK